MALYRVHRDLQLTAPALVASLDGWVNAGAAGSSAAEHIAGASETIVTFDSDALLDYRARRPMLDIVDGVTTQMIWPEITVRRVAVGARDLLLLTGPEPDYRWKEFGEALAELALRLGVVQSVSLGAIGVAVPHTRPTPVMMTASAAGLIEGEHGLPPGLLRVPAAGVSLVEIHLSQRGIPCVGFWAHIPHYVNGPYSPGALALVERVARHLGVDIPLGSLEAEAAAERKRLDEIVASRPEAMAYLERLESMTEPEPMQAVSGDELAQEIEKFLRDSTGGETRNPFEEE